VRMPRWSVLFFVVSCTAKLAYRNLLTKKEVAAPGPRGQPGASRLRPRGRPPAPPPGVTPRLDGAEAPTPAPGEPGGPEGAEKPLFCPFLAKMGKNR